jgi:hypothetical protein
VIRTLLVHANLVYCRSLLISFRSVPRVLFILFSCVSFSGLICTIQSSDTEKDWK